MAPSGNTDAAKARAEALFRKAGQPVAGGHDAADQAKAEAAKRDRLKALRLAKEEAERAKAGKD